MSTVLEALFDPANLIVSLGGGLFIQIIYLAFLTWIVPPRSARAFWAVELVYTTAFLFLKSIMAPPVRIVAGTFSGVIIPALMTRGPLSARIIICVLAEVAQSLAELVCMVGWVSITGLGVVDNGVLLQHAPVYIVTLLTGHVGALSLFMAGIRRLAGRFMLQGDERVRVDLVMGSWVLPYLWFPALQFTLTIIVAAIGFDVLRWSGGTVGVVVALFVLCVTADVLLFIQIGQSVARAQDDVRLDALEERVRAYLHESESSQAMLVQMAHLRHDLRNHRMVVETFCARDEYDRAAAYLEEFSQRLGEGDGA